MTETEVLADEQVEAAIQPPCDSFRFAGKTWEIREGSACQLPAEWITRTGCTACEAVKTHLRCSSHADPALSVRRVRCVACGATDSCFLIGLERL